MNVTLATMHLVDDAKLLWHSKVNDIQSGSYIINSWKDIEKKLRTQLFPENVEFIARQKS